MPARTRAVTRACHASSKRRTRSGRSRRRLLSHSPSRLSHSPSHLSHSPSPERQDEFVVVPLPVDITKENIQDLSQDQLRQLLLQVSGPRPEQQPTPNQVPMQQMSPPLPPGGQQGLFPANQSELIRDRPATQAANTFLDQVGVQQNLARRVTVASYQPPRQHYPSPTTSLPTQNQQPQQQQLQQALIQLLQGVQANSPRPRRKAIQLSDFLLAASTDKEE